MALFGGCMVQQISVHQFILYYIILYLCHNLAVVLCLESFGVSPSHLSYSVSIMFFSSSFFHTFSLCCRTNCVSLITSWRRRDWWKWESLFRRCWMKPHWSRTSSHELGVSFTMNLNERFITFCNDIWYMLNLLSAFLQMDKAFLI